MTRRMLLGTAAAGMFAAERKNRAPVSKENLVVKLPEAAPVKLANGVTLLTLEDNRLPLVYARFQVEGAGSIYSPKPGVAELTAEMLREGVAGRTGKQIVEQAARLGATITTFATGGAEVAVVDGAGLSSRFSDWMEIMAAVLLHPTFPADEFNGLRQRRLVGLRMRRIQTPALADDAALRVAYGNHPAGVTAQPEALAALTPETLAAWHRERYAPSSTVVSCVGRVRASEVASRAEALLGAWKAPEPKFALPPPPEPAATRRILLIDRPGAPQTELLIGGLLFDRRDPDFFPMTVLNNVLGGASSARLNRQLREEKGYTNSASSSFTSTRFPGMWRVRAGVRTDATAESLAIMLANLRRLCDEPVPAAELDESRNSVVGRFALNLEQPQQVITLSYLRYRYGFSADYWERYPAKLMAVSAAEIQAVAQKYLNPDRAHIIAAGDAAKIRPVLAKLGAVEAG